MIRTFTLLLGLPGQGMQLGIDPLSALFLILLIPQITAAAIVSEWRSPTFWVFALGMVLTLLAADAFALILGFELMSAASWLLILKHDRNAATLYAGIALFSAACLIPAFFLPASGLAFALILLGAGAKAGLAPLHFWLPKAHASPPAAISALLSGGMVKIALYIIIRYAFVVDAPAIAPWWGAALMVAGAASAILGAVNAYLEPELKISLAWSTIEHVGLIATGIGIALEGRALDEPGLTAMALSAALLCALAHALFKPLLFLGVGAVKEATGTASLNWLGGLMRGMPRLGSLMLIGAAGLAAIPLGPAFTPEFLLLHALMAGAGAGGILAWLGFASILAILGLSAGLALAGAVRLIGIGFLGRPRTLRAAAAEEAEKPVLLGMAILAACCVPLALLPGLLLRAMRPVLMELAPNALPQPLGYAPLPLVILLLLPTALAYLALRRFGARGEREAHAWHGGLGKPPVWLPFGDPLTQPSGAGFSQPAARIFARLQVDFPEFLILAPLLKLHRQGTRLAERIRRATIRQRLAVVFAALSLSLLAIGAMAGG